MVGFMRQVSVKVGEKIKLYKSISKLLSIISMLQSVLKYKHT